MQEKIMKKIGQKATAVALALGIAVAGISPASAATVNLAGGGATFQADFQAKCLAKFNADNTANKIGSDNLRVSYAGVGSGGGRTGLANNTYAFAGSDSLGITGNLTKANSIWFPVVAAPLAILINLKSSTGAKITSLRLDTLTLSQILNGTITTWNNSQIAALNPGVKLPTTAITVVSRADSSGSTGNLKSYLWQNLGATTGSLAASQKSKWTNGGQTQQDEFARGGIGMSGSPALVAKVASVNGAIGYADLSDVTTAVTTVTMKNVAGGWVKPSASAAALYVKAAGVLTASPTNTATDNGGIYTVDFTKRVTGAYQLTFITYMIAKKGMTTPGYNTNVMKYANYVLTKCSATPSSIGASGYVTVGTTLINAAKVQVAKIDD
jgi:phosphate transport system substrate-binding protein